MAQNYKQKENDNTSPLKSIINMRTLKTRSFDLI